MERLPRNSNGILFKHKNTRMVFVYNEDETHVHVIMRRLLTAELATRMRDKGFDGGFSKIIQGRILETHLELSLDAFATFWAAFDAMGPQPYALRPENGAYTFIKAGPRTGEKSQELAP